MVHRILLVLILLTTIAATASQDLPKNSTPQQDAAAAAGGSSSAAAAAHPQFAAATTEMEHWDHNYSCLFESGRTFTYLHIAYVTYFNITYKAPVYCSSQQCLDSCTDDCSCSAVVYDQPTFSCYTYHDYIQVQTIPFIPVRGRDTITAYIKVQHGYDYNSVLALSTSRSLPIALGVALFLLLLLI